MADLVRYEPRLSELARRHLQDAPAVPFIFSTPPFSSCLVPDYDTAELAVDDFACRREAGDVIFSPPLRAAGLAWRLKVYCGGSGPSAGSFLSVFLELLDGFARAPYQYRIELVPQVPPKTGAGAGATSREFVSEFDAGECWGYNRFHPLATLADNGYIHPDHDRIVLRFYVRATSFEGRCRDLTLYSKHLETQLQRRTSVAESAGGDHLMIVIENPPSPSSAAKHGNTDLYSVGMPNVNSPPSQPAPLAEPSGSELSAQPRPAPQRTASDHAVDLLPLPSPCPPAGRTPSTVSNSIPRRPLVDYDPGAYQATASAAATSSAVATTAASSSLASLYESADAFLSAAESSPSSLSSSAEESAGQHGGTDDNGSSTDDNSEVGEGSESGSAGDAHPGAAITSPVISGSGCSSVIAGADGLEDQNTAVELFLLSLRNVLGNTFGGSLWNDADSRPAPSAAAASDSSRIPHTSLTIPTLPSIQAVGAHDEAAGRPATDVAGLRVGRTDTLSVLRARVGALLAAVSEQLSDADAGTVARLVATPRNPDEGSVGGSDAGGARLQLQGASADEEEALRHRVVAVLSSEDDDSSVGSDAFSGDSLSSEGGAEHSTAVRSGLRSTQHGNGALNLDLRDRLAPRPLNDGSGGIGSGGSGGRRSLRSGVDEVLRGRVAALLGTGEFADDEDDLDDDDDYEDGESGESVDRDNF
ncbi:hypothetical protein HK405_009025, partial [Cladochytrium tenue]